MSAAAHEGSPIPVRATEPNRADRSGLPRDSVVNVTAVVTLNKSDLGDYSGRIPDFLMDDVDRGLRRVLGL